MSAEILRRAASLMRERASMATPGPWRDSEVGGNRHRALVADQPHPDRTNLVAGGWGWDEGYGGCLIGESLMSGDRRHIASWHPAVALAVADWLDNEAHWLTCEGCGTSDARCKRIREDGYIKCCPDCAHGKDALTVARAYLGEVA